MDMNSQDDDVMELHKACRLGNINSIQSAISADPEQINQRDDSLGWTPLYRTVICGHVQATRYLLANGADPNYANNLGEMPLHMAADNSQYTLTQLLLDHGADPNSQRNDGDTPLHNAAFRGDTKMIQILLQNNANVNIANYIFGRTPLHYAAEWGQHDPIKLMLEFGGDSSVVDRQGKTPVDLANDEDLKQLMIDGFAEFSSLLDDENTSDQIEVSKDQDSHILSPITEVASYMPSSPEEQLFSCHQHVDSIALNPDTFGKPIYEFYDFKFRETQDSDPIVEQEPDAEKSIMQLQIRPKFVTDPLYEWLERLNLQYLFELLSEAGFDDVDSMIEQMRSPLPITEETLKNIGIDKPGHCIRLVNRLEEEAGLSRPRTRRRQISVSRPKNIFQCCTAPSNATFGVNSNMSIYEWLEGMKLEHLNDNFQDAGYDDYEFLILQMVSQHPITDFTLINDMNITRPDYRGQILAKLQSDSTSTFKMVSDWDVSMDGVGKEVACELCSIM